MPPDPPRPRQPSRPELPSIRTPDQPERDAVRHPGLDGAEQARPQRKGTLPGGMAAIPVSGEFAPTLPVPRSPLRETIRRPTPPSAVALARRTPVPTSDESTESESPHSGRAEAREAILESELTKERAKVAELERRERVAAESKGPGPYQAPVQRSQSPVPSSAPSKTDAAIGKVVRTTATRLAERYGLMPLLLVFGIGGGVVAVAKPSAEPAKVQALEARLVTVEQTLQTNGDRDSKSAQREALRDAYIQCLLEEVSEGMAQLLPAQDRVGNAAPMKPWVERCSRLKP